MMRCAAGSASVDAAARALRHCHVHSGENQGSVMAEPFKGKINIDLRDSVPDRSPLRLVGLATDLGLLAEQHHVYASGRSATSPRRSATTPILAARAISAAQVDAVALSEAETVAVATAGTRMATDSVPEVKAGLGVRERARNFMSRHVEHASFRLRGVRCRP
jgi:hypothetical protein